MTVGDTTLTIPIPTLTTLVIATNVQATIIETQTPDDTAAAVRHPPSRSERKDNESASNRHHSHSHSHRSSRSKHARDEGDRDLRSSHSHSHSRRHKRDRDEDDDDNGGRDKEERKRRKKSKSKDKDKDRKRRKQSKESERRSVLTGHKIKLKVHKDAADLEMDANREDLLKFLNSVHE
ncbi:hypothetical protein EIP91_010514 [Steccherinum ochraceum]|uniref:Uncharacterized protein n=1 Tax=Steccherinum ochraceum TaxID=92696 RepID=A0A4R0R9F3_9APHY|nr:hypothetical protein EIP91_010514 [Steccherinum ochraceum]